MNPLIPDPLDYLSQHPTSKRAEKQLAQAESLPPVPVHNTGLFSKRHRLPADCQYLANEMESIKAQLETAVCEKHGQVGIHHAVLIDSVLTHHKRVRLIQRWLVHPKHKKQKPWEALDEENTTAAINLEVRLKLLKEESAASDARSKAIQGLGLGEATADNIPWATVFAGMAKAAGVIETKANGGA